MKNLEDMIVTLQQETALKAFRKHQEENEYATDFDFTDWYMHWCLEKGVFYDIPSYFNEEMK